MRRNLSSPRTLRHADGEDWDRTTNPLVRVTPVGYWFMVTDRFALGSMSVGICLWLLSNINSTYICYNTFKKMQNIQSAGSS